MNRIYEDLKLDLGLVGQALNGNATGPYYSMEEFRSALAVLTTGAIAATKTAKIELFEAQDADGTGAALITGAAGTITANTNVSEATVALASVANTDTVTINGIEFTKAASTDATAREFADAAGLVTCVNDPDFGVSGVMASANGTTVTLTSTDPGAVTITLDKTENAGTITLATTKAVAYVELQGLDLSTGFTHVAVKVTTTASIQVAAVLLRGTSRGAITQAVGASAVL